MEREKLFHPTLSDIQVYADKEMAAQAAANEIIKAVQENPKIAITYATGDTMIPVYEALQRASQQGVVDFSNTTAFHLDEYYPYAPTKEFSFVKFLKDRVFNPLSIKPDNIHTLNGLASNGDIEAERYDDLLRKKIVGITLLGIGPGGHIGFNERNTSFTSRTHLAQLSIQTVYRDKIERNQDTPDMALTQGIETILESKRLVMVAYGTTKGDYLHEALDLEVTETCPASALRLHSNKVSMFIDKDAKLQIELNRSKEAV